MQQVLKLFYSPFKFIAIHVFFVSLTATRSTVVGSRLSRIGPADEAAPTPVPAPIPALTPGPAPAAAAAAPVPTPRGRTAVPDPDPEASARPADPDPVMRRKRWLEIGLAPTARKSRDPGHRRAIRGKAAGPDPDL